MLVTFPMQGKQETKTGFALLIDLSLENYNYYSNVKFFI